MKMWSGRFRQPLDPEFEKWQRSFSYDQRLLPFELAASRAHANALEKVGLLSAAELSEIVKALGEMAAAASLRPNFSTIRMRKTFTTCGEATRLADWRDGLQAPCRTQRNEQIATTFGSLCATASTPCKT